MQLNLTYFYALEAPGEGPLGDGSPHANQFDRQLIISLKDKQISLHIYIYMSQDVYIAINF